MTLQLVTNTEFGARQGLLARPPIPDDAAAYADFVTGLHLDQANANTDSNSDLVFGPVSSMKPGYYYGRDDIEFMSGTLWDRVEYGPDGECYGLLIEGEYEQRVIPAHRQNLSTGVAVGAIVAADGVAAQPYQQWYSVTPAGEDEASLTLGSNAVATAGAYLYIAFDLRGDGIAQVGSAGIGYVNCDLRSGEVHSADGAVGQAIARSGGAWTVFCRATVPAGGLEDTAPFVASIASIDTGKRGPSGAVVSARAPRVMANLSAVRPFIGLWPHDTSSAHATDNLTENVAGLDLSGAWTTIFRARSGQLASRSVAGLALLTANGNNGLTLRFDANNYLCLAGRSGPAVWTGATRWKPNTLYRVGISYQSGQIAVSVNGETASVPLSVAPSSFRLLRGFDVESHAWAGHLQKCIWWNGWRSEGELARLTDRWL